MYSPEKLVFILVLSIASSSMSIKAQGKLSAGVFIYCKSAQHYLKLNIIGNLYPALKYKHLIGIKNSWIQSYEMIWKKTYSFAGKVFFWGGLIVALYGIQFDLNPVPYMPIIYVGYVFTLVFIPNQ